MSAGTTNSTSLPKKKTSSNSRVAHFCAKLSKYHGIFTCVNLALGQNGATELNLFEDIFHKPIVFKMFWCPWQKLYASVNVGINTSKQHKLLPVCHGCRRGE